MQIGEAFVAVRPDTARFGPELQSDLASSGQRAASGLSQALGAVAFGALINQGREAASTLEQAIGGTEAVFQENTDTVRRWADNSVESVGLSERAFLQLASGVGGQLTNLGLDLDSATTSSRELITIGSDLAATFGGTTQEAVEALGAAFRGEYDTAERFRLSLTAASVSAKAVELGLAESTGAISSQARAQATLALIQEQSAQYSGQFAREADTEAGARQRAAAEAENQAAAFSDQLLPAYSSALGILSQLAGVFGALPGPIQTGIVALGGFAALRGPVGGALSGIGDAVGAMRGRFVEAGGGVKGFAAAITPGAIGATAAVAGLALIANELADNAQQAAEAEARYQALTDAYAEGGSVGIAEELLATARRDFPQLEDILDRNRVGFGELVAAYEEGGPAVATIMEDIFGGNFSVGDARLVAFLQSIPAAIDAAGELAANEAEINANAAGANVSLDDQVASLDGIADAADAARDSLDSLSGIQKSLDEASIDLQASIDATSDALAENGPTVDISTAAGRANVQALRAQASAIREYLISLAASGASSRDVAAAQNLLTNGLARSSRQAGNTRGQTQELINTYARVPREIRSNIALDGAETAISQLQRIHDQALRAAAAVGQVGGSLAGGGSYGPEFGAAGGTTSTTTGPGLTAVGPPPVNVTINAGTIVGSPDELARRIAPEVGREIERIQRRA